MSLKSPGTQRAVVVSSEEAVREVLIHKQDHFSDRPPSLRAEVLTDGYDVFLANDSAKWRYKKKHLMQAMKQHGDGLKHLESMTLIFGQEMLKEMGKHSSNPFEPNGLFRSTVGSIIMTLTYGYSTQDDVTRSIDLDKRVQKLLNPSGPGMLLDICPPLRFVFPQLKAMYKELVTLKKDMESTFQSFTNIRKQNMDPRNSKIFIDHFLSLAFDSEDPLDNMKITLEEKDIIFICIDMILAGMGTTTALLTNLLGILVNHPHIQDRAYAQINEIIGQRTPTIEDRPNIPFVEAIILEALRYTSFVPLLIPHYSSCSSKLAGYFIPEGTMIFTNLWSLQHDEKYWADPWGFDPSRFLKDGKLVPADHVNKQRVLQFGAGRRQCAGEVFARNRLFILITLMLQKFKFLPAEGHPRPQHDPREYTVNITNVIKPYYVCTQSRL